MRALLICFILPFGDFGVIDSGNDERCSKIRVCSKPDFEGKCEVYSSYVTDLRKESLKGEVLSAQIERGIWILYEDGFFNAGHLYKRALYGWGKDCRIEDISRTFSNLSLSSLRYSGLSDSDKYESVTLYGGIGFMGPEVFIYSDHASLNIGHFGNSILLTGCIPWTFYEREHYQGSSVCLFPGLTPDCWPGFFETPQDFGNLSNRILSARRGCFSNRVYSGRILPPNQWRMFDPKNYDLNALFTYY